MLIPEIELIINRLIDISQRYSNIAMLSRTHGQPATPTTLGKEIAIFAYRANYFLKNLKGHKLTGKCSGAVGSYNAHLVTFPTSDWL